MISEPSANSANTARTAGALLRAAREKQGLHIAALAASMKVAPRKLEALENDRWDELAGNTFTRALAQSVCRALHIDAAPILALLPQAQFVELDHVTGKLNAPFRERSARDEGALAVMAQRGLLWAGALLLLAAVGTYLLPTSWLWFEGTAPTTGGAATGAAASAVTKPALASASAPAPTDAAGDRATPAVAPTMAMPASAASSLVEVTHGAPVAAAIGSASPLPAAAGAAAAPLQLTAGALSWVEVRDRSGRILLSRNVLRGETIGVDGATPLRLTVGNAAVTRVVFRGKPVDLSASQRDNVARIELN